MGIERLGICLGRTAWLRWRPIEGAALQGRRTVSIDSAAQWLRRISQPALRPFRARPRFLQPTPRFPLGRHGAGRRDLYHCLVTRVPEGEGAILQKINQMRFQLKGLEVDLERLELAQDLSARNGRVGILSEPIAKICREMDRLRQEMRLLTGYLVLGAQRADSADGKLIILREAEWAAVQLRELARHEACRDVAAVEALKARLEAVVDWLLHPGGGDYCQIAPQRAHQIRSLAAGAFPKTARLTLRAAEF